MDDNDIKTFVLLKYEILTSDSDTWNRCEATYPDSVKQKWAWRCAADVEHLATKGHHPEAEECIRIAKLYRDGKATIKELDKAWLDVPLFGAAYYATCAACAAYNAAKAAYAASSADAAFATTSTFEREEKWKLYIGWLIEELCEYESNHNG